VQVRRRGSGVLPGDQLVGLSKVLAWLEEELSVPLHFPSAPSSPSVELLLVTAAEVVPIRLVSDLKGLVELRASLPGILKAGFRQFGLFLSQLTSPIPILSISGWMHLTARAPTRI